LVKELKGWRGKNRSSEWIFPNQVAQMSKTHGRPIAASKKFANLLFRAGLRAHTPYGSGCGKTPRPAGDRRQMHPLSFHCLRHTARTLLEESGVPVAVIDALVGHHGEQGRAYTKIGTEALRKAASVLEIAGTRKMEKAS
jgi:integrase